MNKAIMIVGLLNISLMVAMDSKHVVSIAIETKQGHASLQTYFQRLKELEALALSSENVKKVATSQSGYTIYMTVVQNKSNKEQAKILANNLAGRLEQEMIFVDRVKVCNIRKKRLKGF